MAYFQCMSSSGGAGAVITVTYTSSFYNKTMTCTNGTKTYTKTTTSSGSTTFSVSEEGTWTITCNGVSVTVAVVLSYSTQMIPTGSTATPVNDIQTWLKCGGIFDKTYTTIEQVLADTTTLLALISDSNAVDYMVRSTNWASSVCANSTAMTYIGNNNYCANTLLADSTWANAICNSTYFESVLNKKIPTMTGNTSPSGECFGQTNMSGHEYYRAFDNSNSTYWESTGASLPSWVGYKFASVQKIYRMYFLYDGTDFTGLGIPNSISFTLQGSNDGTNYTDIKSVTISKGSNNKYETVESVNANYQYYRVYATSTFINNRLYMICSTLQLHGR